MAISQMRLVWEESSAKGNALLLLVKLADNANDEGYAYPGTRYLMKHTKITSRGTLYNNLLKLEVAGEIIIQPGSGPHNTNVYFIAVGMPLEKVDKMRSTMGLPSREEVAKRLEQYAEKRAIDEDDLPVEEDFYTAEQDFTPAEQDFSAEGVRIPYTEKEPVGVRILNRGCTDFEQGCTDFEQGCTESVHKPSLTIIKPSINQKEGPEKKFEFDFEKFIRLLETQIPKTLFERHVLAWKFGGVENDRIVILCDGWDSQQYCEARLSSTANAIVQGMLVQPTVKVRFA